MIGIVTIQWVVPTVIANAAYKQTQNIYYQQMQDKYFSGILNPVTTYPTLRSCAMKCSAGTDRNCSGFAFSMNPQNSAKCLHIIDDTNVIDRTSATLDSYEFYYLSGKLPMTHWIPPTPTLYFPLDNDTGTRLGNNPENIDFIGGGIVGNAFYNPISGGSKSFLRLGEYHPPQYCFPVPSSCPLGMILAFWVKILGDTGDNQAILSTKVRIGQGIKIIWYRDTGKLTTTTERDADTL